jgi:FkbM family methyltransferase
MRRRFAGVRRRLRAGAPVAPLAQHDAPEVEEVEEEQMLYEFQRDLLDNEHINRLIAWVVGPDDSCIDIGANKGGVLEQIVAVAPHGRHIAFEPLPHLHADLVERFPTVDVHRAALSNHAGESTFAHVRAAEGWSSFLERPLPGEVDGDVVEITVPLEVLDDVLPGGFVPRVIKLDVEGAEQQVIEGAMRTLSTHRPILVFEHGNGSASTYGTTPDDIYRLLCDKAGMRIFDLDGEGPYTRDRFRNTYYAREKVNFVAHA